MCGNLFGESIKKSLEINIYADEIMAKVCPYTGHEWHYIGLVVEDCNNSFIPDLIAERFRNNFDKGSPFYKKNNRAVHWADISSADEKFICKRWFDYILNPSKSGNKFYCSILGLNNSYLNKAEFDNESDFNSKYNRFFRSSIKYALKCFFGDNEITILNLYHEQGQQQHHSYFPWHVIYKLQAEEPKFIFRTDKIEFLQKDHTIDERSNVIQVCDCMLGAITNIIHGVEESNRSKYRAELLDVMLPLVRKMTRESKNKNSSFGHYNRIMISFFPKEYTEIDDLKRNINQFYTVRPLKYEDDISGQGQLF